jgi:predicted HAD superfamily Cof-like phosphohydrolase
VKEQDEAVVVELVSALVEIASEHDKGSIRVALGLTAEKAQAFDITKATKRQKLKIAETIVDEYSYSNLSEDTKKLIMERISEAIDVSA